MRIIILNECTWAAINNYFPFQINLPVISIDYDFVDHQEKSDKCSTQFATGDIFKLILFS